MPPARLAVREARALGSRLVLMVDAPEDPHLVDRAWSAVAATFQDVDRAMSRFRDDSELTLLNRRVSSDGSGEALVPSRMLAQALALADRACRVSEGRFDARVVRDLERLGAPGVPQLAGARDAGGRRDRPLVTRAPRRGPLCLHAPADLGGLGKGLALRWAAGRVAGVLDGAPFLLDAGGDLVSMGLPGGAPWSIGIEDPEGGAAPVATVALLAGQAIATSSVRIGRWVAPDGRPIHHLIDPATGEPGGLGLRAVTVAAPDPAWAEVWSKALFLEGPDGIAAAARRRGLAAWWVDAAGALSMTPAARVQTTWVRAESPSAVG